MPLLYDTIQLNPTGLLSVTPIAIPLDGRKIHFELPEGSLRKKIYIIIDGELKEISNGAPIDTGIGIFERYFLGGTHEAYVMVIDCNKHAIPDIVLPKQSYPVIYADGQKGTIDLALSVQASFCISEPFALANDYINGTVSDPIGDIQTALIHIVNEVAFNIIKSTFSNTSPHKSIGTTSQIAFALETAIKEEFYSSTKWCNVASCNCIVNIENTSEIVDKSNVIYNLSLDAGKALYQAVIDTFGKSPLPEPISNLIIAYIQANPGCCGEQQLISLCSGLNNIWQNTTPDQLVAVASKLGYLPPKGGTQCII